MFRFFSFRKRQKDININPLIVSKLDQIIELLEKQQKENDGGKNIHFDHVQIDYLENIVFRLDNIDIDELSGKLIIGNNISTKKDLARDLDIKINKSKAKNDAMSETNPPNQESIENTSKGFRFRNNF
ncbi:hypothetical protein QE429_003387 [Bacillus sp. SORGH_AS 510]|uniref:hypothetical protein n=1 Tax=Bacillus sp. SORGH_AS_0510 TaxID=3041771 RepID=UPI00277DACFC|nr:hypothetical protein [Bacillus sp. SORGH_AS_0510]MDQ1146560.1 hypothetical protein [Bacillus sp. SORGH_AS_0510]